jgi:hypothetical protein
MYIVIISHINGSVEYHGPFPTRTRAETYGHIAEAELIAAKRTVRWHVVPLVIPYSVVQEIRWRNHVKA